MNALLIALSLINLAMGGLCAWALTQVPPGLTYRATSPENIIYLLYTTTCFLAPALVLGRRKHLSDRTALAIVGLPALFAVAAGGLRVTIR